MQVVQEVTDWEFPNHIYVLNTTGSKAYGYYSVQHGWKVFSRPLPFSKTRRKFKKVVVDLPEELQRDEDIPAGAVIIQGSRGSSYIVHNGTCTCSGYKWKRKCKHLKMAA